MIDLIPNHAYRTNFASLAKKLAPDGKKVSLVGLTTARGRTENRVALRSTASQISERLGNLNDGDEQLEMENIIGVLSFADSTGSSKGKLKLIDDQAKKHTIEVPIGMMTDVVKPHYGERVSIVGVRTFRGIRLYHIERC